MNAKELRGQTIAELEQELIKLKKEQFSLRMGGSDTGAQNHLYGKGRKDIARVKTVMNEKKKAGES